jgi:hypothetical protein
MNRRDDAEMSELHTSVGKLWAVHASGGRSGSYRMVVGVNRMLLRSWKKDEDAKIGDAFVGVGEHPW